MCEIGYHICPQCQDEIKCYQHDSECESLNQSSWACENCEYWQEELHREDTRKRERIEWETQEWERLYGYKG